MDNSVGHFLLDWVCCGLIGFSWLDCGYCFVVDNCFVCGYCSVSICGLRGLMVIVVVSTCW